MKKESNLIDTKEKIIDSFSKEQMETYEYYKNSFSYSNEELYPVIEKDKELVLLEKWYDFLKKVFKIEAVLTLIILTIMIVFNGISNNNFEIKYKSAKFNNTIFLNKA